MAGKRNVPTMSEAWNEIYSSDKTFFASNGMEKHRYVARESVSNIKSLAIFI
jgi:hypothetical protein